MPFAPPPVSLARSAIVRRPEVPCSNVPRANVPRSKPRLGDMIFVSLGFVFRVPGPILVCPCRPNASSAVPELSLKTRIRGPLRRCRRRSALESRPAWLRLELVFGPTTQDAPFEGGLVPRHGAHQAHVGAAQARQRAGLRPVERLKRRERLEILARPDLPQRHS